MDFKEYILKLTGKEKDNSEEVICFRKIAFQCRQENLLRIEKFFDKIKKGGENR